MRRAMFVLLAGVLACLSHEALADSELPPQPYKTVVGRYVFVMMPGHCSREDSFKEVEMTEAEWNAFVQAKQAEAQRARQQRSSSDPCAYDNATAGVGRMYSTAGGRKTTTLVSFETYKWAIFRPLRSAAGQNYPASGLYRNDGSMKPLWMVEWYARETYLSRDGRYLVQMGPWPGHYDNLAIAFHDRGKLIKDYTIRTLVRQPERLPHSMSHFQWRHGNVRLDHEASTITLRTLHNELYVFDISSGAIIRSEQGAMPEGSR